MKQFLLIFFIAIVGTPICAQETVCNQTISGEVRDKMSTDVLVGAEVTLSDENGTVLQTQTIKDDGFFSFSIACETKYTLKGMKEEFTAESKTFTTTDQVGRVLQLIILLDKGNIDFVSDGAANAKAIDSVAKAEVVLSEVATDIVVEELEEPEIKEEVVKEVVEKKIVDVEPVKEVLNIDKYSVNINPVYFDYESSWLNQKAKNDLQKIVDLMREYPKMVVECAAHTDAKGDVKYNQWMSDRRAKRVMDYIVSKGIERSRISGKGFEEKFIINKCTNDVECTDEERAANRRVEFVILKM